MKIEVQRMYRFDTDRPLKAFADIVLDDCLLLKGVRVMYTRGRANGEYWVSMPREQAKDHQWYDQVRCLTSEIREQITQVVLACYNEDNCQSNCLTSHVEDEDDVIIP